MNASTLNSVNPSVSALTSPERIGSVETVAMSQSNVNSDATVQNPVVERMLAMEQVSWVSQNYSMILSLNLYPTYIHIYNTYMYLYIAKTLSNQDLLFKGRSATGMLLV